MINADEYIAIIDSSISLITGPQELISKLLDGVSVKSDCSNVSSLPNLSIGIDGVAYTLTPSDYVLNVGGKCTLGVASQTFAGGANYVVLGDPFLRKFPAHFSLNDNTVQFLRNVVTPQVEETI
jgi:hypothetical protein